MLKKWMIPVLSVVLLLIFSHCREGEKQTEAKDQFLQSNQEFSPDDRSAYLKAGNEITASVFKLLSGELLTAMKEKGFDGALKYCNLNALNLTDSIAESHGAMVNRLAERYRNPKNALMDSLDIAVYEEYLDLPGDELVESSRLHRLSDNSVVYFKPIVLQGQCVACHGSKSTIGEDNYESIKSIYPNDKAIGFKPGDLRGIWRVEWAG